MKVVVVAIGALALITALGPVGDVRAECTGSIYFPPFKEVVRSARQVLIGVVDRNFNKDSGQPRFSSDVRLRVESVVRGSPAEFVRIREWPAVRGGCNEVVYLQEGWRIAVAIDGSAHGVDGRVNAVAYLDHDPDRYHEIGIPRLTEQQVRDLAALPDTATAPSTDADGMLSAVPSFSRMIPLVPVYLPWLFEVAIPS